MRPLTVHVLLGTLLVLSLTTCSTLEDIIATEPEGPSEESVVRLLCARDAQGNFMFGDIVQSHQDTLTHETQQQIDAHNAAWDAATKNGTLCGKMGGAAFGGMKWGTN